MRTAQLVDEMSTFHPIKVQLFQSVPVLAALARSLDSLAMAPPFTSWKGPFDVSYDCCTSQVKQNTFPLLAHVKKWTFECLQPWTQIHISSFCGENDHDQILAVFITRLWMIPPVRETSRVAIIFC
jgi:hypothetical protein